MISKIRSAQARQVIVFLIVIAFAISNGKIVVLEIQGPLIKKTVKILHLLDPLQGGVISQYSEQGSVKEGTEVFYSQKNGKALSLSDDLVSVVAGEGLSIIICQMIHQIQIQLGQNNSNSYIASICEEDKVFIDFGVDEKQRGGQGFTKGKKDSVLFQFQAKCTFLQ